MIEGFVVNVQLLENKAGEITAGECLLYIVEIVNNVQQTGTGSLLILILGLIWGYDYIYIVMTGMAMGLFLR